MATLELPYEKVYDLLHNTNELPEGSPVEIMAVVELAH